MKLIDVLDKKDIDQIDEKVRGLLNDGTLTKAITGAIDAALNGKRFRLDGYVGSLTFDLTFWREDSDEGN